MTKNKVLPENSEGRGDLGDHETKSRRNQNQ